jgi:hypothetical protein
MRRIDGSPDGWWRVQEHSQPVPVGQPARPARGVLGVPAVGKALQGLLRIRKGGGTIDRPQGGRHGPARFPPDLLEAVTHRMDYAELHLGHGKPRLDRRGEPLEAIDTGHKTVLDAAILQLGKDGEPKFRALARTEP